jgi:signal transduction histidine kinase
MVVQNSEKYGHDRDFQESAMRIVRNTSQRIIDLMAKLADDSKDFNTDRARNVQPVDMNELIAETVEELGGEGCTTIFCFGENLPTIHVKVEPLKQVLLNVILNARQAMDGIGVIHIFTTSNGLDLMVEIVDEGPGIPIDRLENLFQPFKSSKKTGLGVGLFQCKQMVEDNHGQIRIESQEGHGTKVILTFPVKTVDT